jgi:hypothetical protein
MQLIIAIISNATVEIKPGTDVMIKNFLMPKKWTLFKLLLVFFQKQRFFEESAKFCLKLTQTACVKL